MAILKNIFLFISLLLLTTGCFSDFEPDLKSVPVLCMNSNISAGDTVVLQLTRTWRWSDPTVDEQNIIVDDAEVRLYVNDEFIETLHFAEIPPMSDYPGSYDEPTHGYRSGYVAKEGDCIKLTAHSEKYGDAWAEVTVPESIDISHVDYDVVSFSSFSRGSYHRYNFGLNMLIWFTDRASTTDYYEFSESGTIPDRYYIPVPGQDNDEECFASFTYFHVDYDKEPLFTEHVSALESAISDTWGYSIFSDRQISGKSYPLHISIRDLYYNINNPENNPELETASIDFHLDVISRSYYNHVMSVWAHNDGINGVLGDVGLADPVWDASNVSTGAGVVAARSRATYRLYLQDIVNREEKATPHL